ncbi:MAG TPA: TraB/GumN family protein [Steroidobacteraceae bacterium]|nr:TraB/GumN family protein [Steroidobacteraceae bacterium]
MSRNTQSGFLAALLVCSGVAVNHRVNAQEPGAAEPHLEEILVVGEQPGPAMWRVSKGDHTLWIFATLEPLPKDMVWHSKSVDERIAASQLVLSPPELSAHVGFFRSMTLVPSLLRARHPPNGQTLEQSLPHDLYIRWLALRVKYLGNADNEKLRPLLAAANLYRRAINQFGLTHDSHVWQRIEATAKAMHVPVQPVSLEVPIDNPKQYVRDLSAIPSAGEIDCLRSTIGLVETQLPVMRTRANLWSTGDIERLSGLLQSDAVETCASAVLVVPSFQKEYARLHAQLQSAWLAAAEKAIAANVSSVSVLSMTELLKPDGWLALFRARGYEITEP